LPRPTAIGDEDRAMVSATLMIRAPNLVARIAFDAYRLFLADEGWAIASHIALSTLMAMFPFLIVLTTLAAFLGSKELADEAAQILLQAWPAEVAGAIGGEIHEVLTTPRSGLLTLGIVLALYFASSGVESLRIGLNRAYDVKETRPWWWLRLESIAYVLIGALGLIAISFLVVFEPLLFRAGLHWVPWLTQIESRLAFARYGVTAVVLTVALVVAHKWLPAGGRRFSEIVPGIAATLILWLAGGALFGRYLAEFDYSYVATYAGLASAMMALVFLYWSASIFLYGGELNAALKRRTQKAGDRPQTSGGARGIGEGRHPTA
jgi:membrane protein